MVRPYRSGPGSDRLVVVGEGAVGVIRTAVIMVGRTLGAEQFRDSHLYSPGRDRGACGS